MDSKSKTHRMNELADNEFRLRVFPRNPSHNPAADLRGKYVGQGFGFERSKANTESATLAANPGGTAFPICFAISILLPVNLKVSGKD